MGEKWRCPRCGHEIVETSGFCVKVPRCYECATFEVVVPGTPKMRCPLAMVPVREAA